jgi:Tfp pilus assembly protein PilW
MRAGDRGLSLVELVIALGVMLAVTAGLFSVMHPAQGAFAAEQDVADMQQRLRVASDVLSRDLALAGAGAYGPPHAGPLTQYFAPVLPFRQGATNVDAPGTFAVDRPTLLAVPPTAAETTLTAPLASGAVTLQVARESNCAAGVNLCGFTANLPVLVFDEQGSVSLFTVTSVADALLQVTVTRPPNGANLAFAAGSTVVAGTSRTYFLKTDPATETMQLMQYDGTSNADVPVLDHIVGLTFDYAGDPAPPTLTKAIDDPVGPWTTYGPKPPPIDVQATGYPAGENCAFMLDANGQPVPRLATLASGTALVTLTSQQLTDGPWCPDAASDSRWDADLLRVRAIGVTLRVEVASAALRGPAGALFVNGGSAIGGARWMPDREVRFTVTPRNLNAGR